ncbi:hypothetical protein [Roseiflexus sp.]|uniref:hypothetical protein n=1 Tax=Roseiflexus sp. TaxID=2562120 RepID=UPI00398AC28E
MSINVLDPNILRRNLLLEAAIDKQLDVLVQQANRTATLLKNTKMEENQLRNLLNVAVTSSSREVVINFIRYQIARDKDKWGQKDDDFGHTVIRDLRETMDRLAGAVEADVKKNMPHVPEAETLRQTAYVRLMQLYLGYLNRAFYYGKKTNDFERLRGNANG